MIGGCSEKLDKDLKQIVSKRKIGMPSGWRAYRASPDPTIVTDNMIEMDPTTFQPLPWEPQKERCTLSYLILSRNGCLAKRKINHKKLLQKGKWGWRADSTVLLSTPFICPLWNPPQHTFYFKYRFIFKFAF